MFEGILSVITERFKRDRRVLLVLLIPIFIFFVWFGFDYFSKGTLSLTIEGPEGSSRIFISSVSDPNFQELSFESHNLTTRLKPGTYKVSSVIYNKENNQTEGFNELAKSKTVEVKARQTIKLEFHIEPLPVQTIVEVQNKVSNINKANNQVITTSVYGDILIFNTDLEEEHAVTKEGGALRGIVGLCNFNNGTSVTVDTQGAYYFIDNKFARELEVASILNADELSYLEFKPSSSINNTPNFICRDKSLDALGLFTVYDNGSMARISPDTPYISGYRNIKVDEWGGSVSFDSVSIDSFDHDSQSQDFQRSFTYTSIEGESQKIDTPTYITDIFITSKEGSYCYFYTKDIYCSDSIGSDPQKILTSSSSSINNLAVINTNELIYSEGLAIWRYNTKTEESTNLYSTKQAINEGTILYDRKSNELFFSTTSQAVRPEKNNIVKLTL